MSDFNKIFEDMMAQGQKMAKQFAPASDMLDASSLEKIMPGLSKQFIDMAFGNSINKGGLDARTRFLVTIAALTAQGATQEAPLKLAIKSARAADATQRDIMETILTMSMFGGPPAVTAAMKVAQDVFAAEENKGEDA